jgi:hypothetical protein
MNPDFDKLLDADTQGDLADDIVAATAAVVADAQAPDFAERALARNREKNLRPDQAMLAAALQAYGVEQAGPVFAAALADNPMGRADALRQSLTDACGADLVQALVQALVQDERSASAFKSRLCGAIAAKAADMVAVELARSRQAPLAIDDPNDAEVFRKIAEAQHRRHVDLLTQYLRSLPQRYPALANEILPAIARDIRHEIGERYKSPDIQQAIDDIFRDALGEQSAGAQVSSARPASAGVAGPAH